MFPGKCGVLHFTTCYLHHFSVDHLLWRKYLSMDSPDNYIDASAGEIRSILQNAHVAQADIHVEHFQHTQHHGTLHSNDVDHREDNADNEGTAIYAIGSLTKLLIAVILSIIVDRLSISDKSEDKLYRRLRRSGRDPWETKFTILFNEFSEQKMAPLPRDPTLRHVLIHFNSLPPMNFILLAPDGTSLMSAKEFIEVAPRLARAAHDTQGDNYIEYSNGNYILIGLLINAIAPQYTLQELMTIYIFEPLGMTHTYMNSTDLGDVRHARPHVVSTSGIRELLDTPSYSVRAIVSPAMAAWSCIRDLAVLLREFLQIPSGDGSLLTRDSLRRLLKPDGILDETDPESSRQTPCGIHTALSSLMPGSKSINRLIAPTKVCSTYRLGLRKKAEVYAYYMAGAVNGYASCLYFIPTRKIFVIVLTNTSGFTDASDHISRYILQDILDLKRTTGFLATLGFRQIVNHTLDLHPSDLLPKVDIPNMSLLAAQEGEKLLSEWESEDAQEDAPNTTPLQLHGTYGNELTQQLIAIRLHDNRLVVNIKGAADTSRAIGLHRTGNFTFRLYPLSADGFTIDRYDPYGWRDLTFDITVEEDGDGNQRAAAIERHGVIPVSMRRYKRL
jgi:CubicO group peptidase (beta-lactamase class C family)